MKCDGNGRMDGWTKGCGNDEETKRKPARWFGLRIRFLFGFSVVVTCHRVFALFVYCVCPVCTVFWGTKRESHLHVFLELDLKATVNAVLCRRFLGVLFLPTHSLRFIHSHSHLLALFSGPCNFSKVGFSSCPIFPGCAEHPRLDARHYRDTPLFFLSFIHTLSYSLSLSWYSSGLRKSACEVTNAQIDDICRQDCKWLS